ncbi:hypothetical protein [Streptomyces vastus]|uniref:hypothetical protein n=1 Tax=Streptomyces vastus TaxID=285451 RepID=UPI0031D13A85
MPLDPSRFQSGKCGAVRDLVAEGLNTAITTCFHEMYTVLDENLAPFPMQDVVTKVWEETAEGWRLAHMVMGRRFPPV